MQLRFIAVAAAALLAGCDGPIEPREPPPATDGPASIVIAVPNDTLRVGFPMQLTAVARDEDGEPMAARIWWRSSDISVLHVDPSGYADPRSAGSAWVIGGVDALVDSVQVHVLRPFLILRIRAMDGQTSTPYQVVEGVGLQLTVHAYLSNGDPYPYDGPLRWESTDVSVATVDSLGFVRVVSTGHASILVYGEAVAPDGVSITTVPDGTTTDDLPLPPQPFGAVPIEPVTSEE